MNAADLLIILCFIAFLVRGIELGFIQQAMSTAGFIGGLLLGGFLQHEFVQGMTDQSSRAIMSLLVVLGAAFIGLFIGELSGGALRARLHAIDSRLLERTDKAGGSVIAGMTILIAAWLLAGLAIHVPDAGIQKQVRESTVIKQLNSILPDAPQTLTRIGKFINPNGFPKVFVGTEPALDTNTPLPDLGTMQAAVEKARGSVVKITGRGCGGIVNGSGFVAADDRIITNAHVVAGVDRPQIIDSGGTHAARVIRFDPELDIAVLAATTAAPALALSGGAVVNGSPGVALGFPGGGPFTASPATVLDAFVATGRNIYGDGQTRRSVYSLKTDIHPGNSGGPLINGDGAVTGVIFAESTTYQDVGYALTMDAVLKAFSAAQAGNGEAVSTGGCSA